MIFYILICSMLSSKAFHRITNLHIKSNFVHRRVNGIKTSVAAKIDDIKNKNTVLSYPNLSSNLTEYNEFEYLGLVPELVTGLISQEISIPTPVQRAVIPRLLSGENLVMAASTGSGKTLAFFLPTAQLMHAQELQGYQRQVKRPRCLVLVPTRELARQVLSTVKSLSHYCKLSSTALMGGEDFSLQKRSLDKLIDVVVGSPERVIQHKEKGHLYMSQVTHVIIDEVDTMLTQGFGSHIRAILRSVMNRNNNNNATQTSGLLNSTDAQVLTPEETNSKQPLQLIMASATLTKSVKALLTDVDGAFNIEFNDPGNLTPRKKRETDATVKMKIVEVDGVHRTLPHVKHDTQDVKGADKIVVLQEVMSRYDARKFRTMIFCNTIDSARAVDYALTEAGHVVQSYHGDLNSKERETGLDRFRSGERQYLVCTDIAARGIDIPEVDHVIMFDFPMNPIDYLHRAGRCGRAGRKGLVTALVAKRDQVLSKAIQGAITRGLPIDELTSEKKDYQDKGKLAAVMGRQTRQQASEKARKEAARNKELGLVAKTSKVGVGARVGSSSSGKSATDKPRSAMASRMNESLKERLMSRKAAATAESGAPDSFGPRQSTPKPSSFTSRGRPSEGGPRGRGAGASGAPRSRSTRVPTSSGSQDTDDRPRRPSSGGRSTGGEDRPRCPGGAGGRPSSRGPPGSSSGSGPSRRAPMGSKR